jgi:TPR repeat protein
MYFTGRGVLQDYAEAHKWFNLAASRYSTSDISSRDQAIRDREKCSRQNDPRADRGSAEARAGGVSHIACAGKKYAPCC